jgi:hypothetical protein
VVGRLVVEPGDGAARVGAEGVLRRGVGVAVTKKTDVDVPFIGLAHDLVEWAGIRAVQSACGADRSNTRRRGRDEITRTRCGRLRGSDADQVHRKGEKKNGERQDVS